jgi:hypothetical protein
MWEGEGDKSKQALSTTGQLPVLTFPPVHLQQQYGESYFSIYKIKVDFAGTLTSGK